MKIQLEQERLVVFESALYRTTSTLIIAKNYLLLVDPNWLPIEIDFIATYIDHLHLYGHDRYLLFTHSDYDHIIGYGRFKDWQTIASQNFVSNQDTARILAQIHDFDSQYYISRSYPIEYPGINIEIVGDEQKSIGDDPIHFYQSPGHNVDGLFAYWPTDGIMIAGDYLSNVEFPFIDFNFLQYAETLKKFKTLLENERVKILIPGHGDSTTDQNEMLLRLSDAVKYLEDLEADVLHDRPFDFQSLSNRYPYLSGMKEMHAKNIEVFKRKTIST